MSPEEFLVRNSIGAKKFKSVQEILNSKELYYVSGSSIKGYIIFDFLKEADINLQKNLRFRKDTFWLSSDGSLREIRKYDYPKIFDKYETAIQYISLLYLERKRVTDKAKETYLKSLEKFEVFDNTMDIYRETHPEYFV